MPILQDRPEGLGLAVVVQPKASRSEAAGRHGEALKLRLTAPPVEGAANRECVRLLAKLLGVAKSRVEIVGGHAHRSKKVLIHCAPEERAALRQALDNLLQAAEGP
jgi:uncharacterized protein (TIGR00251 family)